MKELKNVELTYEETRLIEALLYNELEKYNKPEFNSDIEMKKLIENLLTKIKGE